MPLTLPPHNVTEYQKEQPTYELPLNAEIVKQCPQFYGSIAAVHVPANFLFFLIFFVSPAVMRCFSFVSNKWTKAQWIREHFVIVTTVLNKRLPRLLWAFLLLPALKNISFSTSNRWKCHTNFFADLERIYIVEFLQFPLHAGLWHFSFYICTQLSAHLQLFCIHLLSVVLKVVSGFLEQSCIVFKDSLVFFRRKTYMLLTWTLLSCFVKCVIIKHWVNAIENNIAL